MTCVPKKKDAVDAALDRLRNNDPDSRSVDDPTLATLASLVGVPVPRGKLSLMDKKPIIE